jgi:hypothetical protein
MPASVAAQTVPPDSMASTGDSITHAFNTGLLEYPFQRRHVSTRDYFHPSLEGQRALAEVTWNAGPFAGF